MRNAESELAQPESPRELFVAFTLLALQGFGGVLAVAQRVLCDQHRWLTREQFVETLAIGQILPGPNICNIALMIGDRFFGWRGAIAALAGMMLVPLIIVLVVTAVYVEYASHPVVAGALRGMGAIAAGMMFGTALKLAETFKSNPMGILGCLVFAGATFLCVAILQLPLIWILPAVGIPSGLFAAWRLDRARRP